MEKKKSEGPLIDYISYKVPLAHVGDSIGKICENLESRATKYDSIDYIYVLNNEGYLKGVFSIKTLFTTPDKTCPVEEVMITDLITAKTSNTPNEMVYLALSNGIKAVPVLDDNELFLGAILYDDILKIFNKEVQKSVFHFGGLFHKVGEEYTTINSSAMLMIRSRLPWLIIGVLGGTLAATVITSFEDVLSGFIALAAFIPVMVYMSDAAGTQSEALIIRSLALEPSLAYKKYFLRELRVSLVIGAISGLIIGVISFIGWSNFLLGAIVGFSMFFSIMVAVMIATLSPLLFKKLKFDPAVATGPLATIVSDLVTLTIYFGVSMLLIYYL